MEEFAEEFEKIEPYKEPDEETTDEEHPPPKRHRGPRKEWVEVQTFENKDAVSVVTKVILV